MKRTYPDLSQAIGERIEIPVHYDLWMRGARFGVIRSYHRGKPGESDYVKVKMDHWQIRKQLKLWRPDWAYIRRELPHTV